MSPQVNTSINKGSEAFTQAIESYIMQKKDSNPLFAKKVCNPKKNITDCITYIINSVKDSGRCGFADDEIYSLATHYYEEDDCNPGRPISSSYKIICNHKIELSQEEIEEIRQKAKDEIFTSETNRLKRAGSISRQTSNIKAQQEETLTLF